VKTTLSEVCTITMGQAPVGDSYNDRGEGLPLIAGAGDFDGLRISPKKFTTAPGKISAAGDIVLSIRASIGAKVWADGEYCLGRGVAGLRPKTELDSNYLWHWLAHAEPTLAAKGRGATFLQVNRRDIGELDLELPPVHEQRRIAMILDQADAIRTKRRQILTHLDILTQSIFHDMFDAVSSTVELGDSLTFVTSGGRGWAKYYSETGARFIQSLDVRMGSIADRDPVYVQAPDNAEARRTQTRVGDVLLTITGSRIGRTAALPDSVAGAYVSQHVAILRPDPDRLRSEFLAAMLGLPRLGQRLIAAVQYGQTKPGLNFEQIRAFALPRPDLNAQDEFTERVGQISSQRAVIQRAAAADDELFASLQSRAFDGDL
jgi:type I restriction enzyme, S subunit